MYSYEKEYKSLPELESNGLTMPSLAKLFFRLNKFILIYLLTENKFCRNATTI
jgi:hypothetical protein